MCDAVDYKVRFGRVARTLVYEDVIGELVFVFDFHPSEVLREGKSTLYLSNGALIKSDGKSKLYQCNTKAESDRLATAIERAREFVISCGYIFDFDGVSPGKPS